MKYLFALLSLGIFTQSRSQYLVEIPALDSVAINKADWIELVSIAEVLDETITVKWVTSYKGPASYSAEQGIRKYNNTFNFHVGQRYLIFGSSGKNFEMFIDRSSRIVSEADCADDIKKIVSFLPCYNAAIRSNTGACTRQMSIPVCGCDNRRYGSPCEAYLNGIMMTSAGECK